MNGAPHAGGENDGQTRLEAVFTITNKRGLHARASSKFVQLAEGFSAAITVAKDGTRVGGTSIMGLMLLAAGPGSTIEVTAQGSDANAALDAIGALIEDRFGEGE
ncbi:MAG: HPr family phosphocarrier protein [Roseitalea sp.]|jgi:phosphocarrier protein|nr:HPr family phosphocarrier protein [Roseitalea sp.]MBO6722837.1 HPr family phosphocarrier protein [Roseitalea sp.]MBO6743048.1 HPr family phosphocarrier protein [Roseitalea sp.]